MFERMKNLELVVKHCMGVKPGQHVLIVTDDYARSIKMSQQVAELCSLEGAEPVICIKEPSAHQGHEPPRPVAAAMAATDIILDVGESYNVFHTTASLKARERGVKYFCTFSQIPEDYFKREISADDLYKIKERSDRLAEKMSGANEARIYSPYGTDLKLSLKGRKGLSIHPLSEAALGVVPDYGEGTIAPVEGSTEGVLVVDGSVEGWNFLLREPMRLVVKKGRVTEVSGPEEYVQRFKKLLAMDENACNCAAEFAIGTSHVIPKDLKGWIWDFGIAGNIHIAVGRNNTIGGETLSQLHLDLLISKGTVWLDNLCVLEKGEVKV